MLLKFPALWWRNLSLKTKSLLVVSLPSSAIILGLSCFCASELEEREANEWVTHTVEVRTSLERLRTELLSVEMAVCDYLLAPKQEFLENYHSAAQKTRETIAALATRVSDNRVQLDRLREFAPIVEERFRTLALLTERADVPDYEREPLLLRGRALLDTLHDKLNDMDAAEDRLLAERFALEQQSGTQGVIAFSACVLVGAVGVVGVRLLSNGVVRRVQFLEQNARYLAQDLPLEPATSANDELGRLEQELNRASALLRERTHALREKHILLHEIIEGTKDAIFARDIENRYLLVNAAAARNLGRPAHEIIGKRVEELVPVETARLFQERDYRVLEAGKEQSFEQTVVSDEDGPRIIHTMKGVLRDLEGKPIGVVGVSRDITQRKHEEEALKEARREAEHAREEAERANLAKSEFLSRMSHELRTPLNAILGFGQLLELEATSEEQIEGLTHILKAGRHLLSLINEILDLSRIEAGHLSISKEPVRMAEVVSECVQLMRPAANERGIELNLDPNVCKYYVIADQQRLKQVVLNLLSNAVKYNRDKGSVSIFCEEKGGEPGTLRLNVRDTGYGILPQDLELLFEPFERLGAEKSQTEGTGLGLPLSKRLIEAQGGTMGVESVHTQGSTFWIELPLTEAPLATAQDSMEQLDDESGNEALSPSATLLYIEDNLSNLRLIERILTRRPGIRLVSAMQGRLGLELALQQRPDLILLDLHLPDLSGAEVLRRLRGEERTRDVPVLVVSADATKGEIERVLAAGAQDYLTKPIDVRHFLEAIDQHLSSRA